MSKLPSEGGDDYKIRITIGNYSKKESWNEQINNIKIMSIKNSDTNARRNCDLETRKWKFAKINEGSVILSVLINRKVQESSALTCTDE
jgi:hypothetical protein